MSDRANDEQLQLDDAAIDEAVLGLLWLGLHDERRVWKSFDWSAMERLHAEGFISDPVGKAKSVVLTEEGLARAERSFPLGRVCDGLQPTAASEAPRQLS